MQTDKTPLENSGKFPTVVLTDEEKCIKVENKQKKKEKQRRRREKHKLKGKQGKRNTPRPVRLEKSRAWVAEYEGTDIIKAYRKHFATTPECAFEELKILGVPMTEEYITKFRESQRNRTAQERNKKLKRRARLRKKREAKSQNSNTAYDHFPDSDDRFFFIAGYTSGGAPYGVTWEEMGMEPHGVLEENDPEGYENE